jgi:hypothetical protein
MGIQRSSSSVSYRRRVRVFVNRGQREVYGLQREVYGLLRGL